MAKQLVVNDVETALIVSKPQMAFVGHNATKQHIVAINEPAEDGPIEIFLIPRSSRSLSFLTTYSLLTKTPSLKEIMNSVSFLPSISRCQRGNRHFVIPRPGGEGCGRQERSPLRRSEGADESLDYLETDR